MLRLSWRGLKVSCSVVRNKGGAGKAAEISVVVAGSVKAAAFYMRVGYACCEPNSTVVVAYDTMCLIGYYLRRNDIVRLSRKFINSISNKNCKEFITKKREVDAVSTELDLS